MPDTRLCPSCRGLRNRWLKQCSQDAIIDYFRCDDCAHVWWIDKPFSGGRGPDVAERPNPRSGPLNLIQGTLDLLILQTLSRGQRHGCAIAKFIEEQSSGTFAPGDSALYPALQRLERRAHIVATPGLSETKKPAKFYTLTDAGRQAAHHLRRRWEEYGRAVAQVMSPPSRCHVADRRNEPADAGTLPDAFSNDVRDADDAGSSC